MRFELILLHTIETILLPDAATFIVRVPHTFAFCANVWETLDSVRKKCATMWLVR